MDTLEKVELTTSMPHIARFLKSGIPIDNPDVPDTAGRKTTTRRTKATTKRFAFYANATSNEQRVMSGKQKVTSKNGPIKRKE